MKKVLGLMVLIIIVFVCFNRNVTSWVKTNLISKPKPYYQQRQEFFEKLSKEYYGVSDYSEELEVINRTFQITESSTERVDLIIPSLDAINKLKQRRTVASLENDPYTRIVKKNPPLLANRSGARTLLKEVDHLKGSTVILLISVICISAMISLMSYLKYRRKTRRSAWLTIPDDEPIITDDRILLDFDISNYEQEEYNPNRTHLEKAA